MVISLEEAPKEDFTGIFDGAKLVYFTAGAGWKGYPERTVNVDWKGAVKVFDAIEGVDGPKPRLILVSSIDVRDPKKIPAHYVGRLLYIHRSKCTDARPVRMRKISPFPSNFGPSWTVIWTANTKPTKTLLRAQLSSGPLYVQGS